MGLSGRVMIRDLKPPRPEGSERAVLALKSSRYLNCVFVVFVTQIVTARQSSTAWIGL